MGGELLCTERVAKRNNQMQGKPKRVEVNWHCEFQGRTNVFAGRASRDQR